MYAASLNYGTLFNSLVQSLVQILILRNLLLLSKQADEYELSVNDGATTFKEKIVVDLAANTELLKVPAHGSSPAADVLYDFNVVSSTGYLKSFSKYMQNMQFLCLSIISSSNRKRIYVDMHSYLFYKENGEIFLQNSLQ